MKLLFDESLSPRLIDLLSDLFPESESALRNGLACRGDLNILKYAFAGGFVLVTDGDFERLFNVATQMSGTTICLLSDSVAMPVGATVTKFKEEFQYFCKNGKSMVAEKFGKDAIRL